MKRPLAIILFALLALLAALAFAQTDPRWTDDDPNNDPNTCFDSGNCITETDWKCGWSQARQQNGLQGIDECDPVPYVGEETSGDTENPMDFAHIPTPSSITVLNTCQTHRTNAIAAYHTADKTGTDAQRKTNLTNAVATWTPTLRNAGC